MDIRAQLEWDERIYLAALLMRNQGQHIDMYGKLNVLDQFPRVKAKLPELDRTPIECHCGMTHAIPGKDAHTAIMRECAETIAELFPNGIPEYDTCAFLCAEATIDAIMAEPHKHAASVTI